MDLWITQLKLFLINIATPHEFGLPCEKNVLPPHSFAHCFSESSFGCVSCRNIVSAFFTAPSGNSSFIKNSYAAYVQRNLI